MLSLLLRRRKGFVEPPPEGKLFELRRRSQVNVGIERKRSDPLPALQHVLQHVVGAQLVTWIARDPLELAKDFTVLEPEKSSEPARLPGGLVFDVDAAHEGSARLDVGVATSEVAL